MIDSIKCPGQCRATDDDKCIRVQNRILETIDQFDFESAKQSYGVQEFDEVVIETLSRSSQLDGGLE